MNKQNLIAHINTIKDDTKDTKAKNIIDKIIKRIEADKDLEASFINFYTINNPAVGIQNIQTATNVGTTNSGDNNFGTSRK